VALLIEKVPIAVDQLHLGKRLRCLSGFSAQRSVSKIRYGGKQKRQECEESATLSRSSVLHDSAILLGPPAENAAKMSAKTMKISKIAKYIKKRVNIYESTEASKARKY